MREIPVDEVADTVRRLCIEANHELRGDRVDALRRARSREESPIGQEVLDRLLANAEVSAREQIAFCPDTGYLVDAIDATGIGPAGFGGTVTTLAVHVEAYPTHIAAFPVAINLDCRSHRVRTVTL